MNGGAGWGGGEEIGMHMVSNLGQGVGGGVQTSEEQSHVSTLRPDSTKALAIVALAAVLGHGSLPVPSGKPSVASVGESFPATFPATLTRRVETPTMGRATRDADGISPEQCRWRWRALRCTAHASNHAGCKLRLALPRFHRTPPWLTGRRLGLRCMPA